MWSFLGVHNDQMTDIPLDGTAIGVYVIVSHTVRSQMFW